MTTMATNGEDRRLLDLVESVLVDPNLHTDMRMRLHRELEELTRHTHARLNGGAPAHVAPAPVAESPAITEMLESVLVDPNLHTDERMRLHREIRELLARHRA